MTTSTWKRVVLPLVFLVQGVCSADEAGTCDVDNDGNCMAPVTVTGSAASKDAAANDANIPPFPEQVDGFMDTGFGEKQRIEGEHSAKTLASLLKMHRYMHSEVLPGRDRILQSVASECLLRNELCAFWAAIGECEANPAYMTLQCAPACLSCEQLAFESRCPMPDTLDDVWQPGDLNKMFEMITSEPFYKKQFDIEVLLKPGVKGKWGDSPWVVVVDNFLTEEECDTLIQLGADEGYEQSKDVGAKKFDGTYDSNLSSGRTSTNAWCLNDCYNSSTTQHVLNKIENITAIPDSHSEYLQLLRYEEGQFYESHHDYIAHHTERAQGVRILTVFLYLNDVEAGGGTNFPVLNMTVHPKRGRALIWPSVKDGMPHSKDARTDHQALPVEKGIKYGANAWLHQRDFKTPFKNNCI